MLHDDLLHDRKSDARSRFARLLGAFRAVELFEDSADFFLIHSDSLILDGQTHPVACLSSPIYSTRVTGRGIFDGVCQQIIDRIFHQFAIADESRRQAVLSISISICLASASGRRALGAALDHIAAARTAPASSPSGRRRGVPR